jgi:Uma2 family endonuclease
MIQSLEQKTYTPEEYLEFEINSDRRHEYVDGKIVAMTGGTPAHNELAICLAAFLKFALRGKPYRVFGSDQRLWIPEKNLYTYPDVMVVSYPFELHPDRTDTIINSLIIAEVLSKSTRTYDRDEKFAAYRAIPSFQEYLLIDQYMPYVEHYSRTGSQKWLFTEYKNLDSKISLSSLDFELKLADLYENLDFV